LAPRLPADRCERQSDVQHDRPGTNTTQLFFDQSLVNSIYTSVAPYASRGANPTTNAGDRVFAQEQHSTGVLSLTGSAASGFAATYTIDLPITAA
jgi:hypothetical protein